MGRLGRVRSRRRKLYPLPARGSPGEDHARHRQEAVACYDRSHLPGRDVKASHLGLLPDLGADLAGQPGQPGGQPGRVDVALLADEVASLGPPGQGGFKFP
jgi:hypothetical protein